MRTKKELQSKEFQEDLQPLYAMLIAKGIKCSMRLHAVVQSEPKVKELIGYYPTGTYQIIIEKDNTTYSVIRGMVSFGDYEIMNTGKGKKFKEPERFTMPEELVEALCPPQPLTPKKMREEKRDKIIKMMKTVIKAVENDTADFDGKPFTGKIIAEYMGYHGAAIVAVASAIKEMLEENT
jgi:hypothetical protein